MILRLTDNAERIVHVPRLPAIPQQLAVVFPDFTGFAVVLHDDDLIVVIGGFLQDGGDAPAQV